MQITWHGPEGPEINNFLWQYEKFGAYGESGAIIVHVLHTSPLGSLRVSSHYRIRGKVANQAEVELALGTDVNIASMPILDLCVANS